MTMNLSQKLVEIRKAIPALTKDKSAQSGERFDYVSSGRVLNAIRAEMDRQGVLLVPDVIGHEVRDHETKAKTAWYFTILAIRYTWINADDPADRIEWNLIGQGLDSGEKGVGKALTYAEKYGLLKFFNIPTDGDDPDAGHAVQDGETHERATQVRNTSAPATDKQLGLIRAEWQKLCEECGITDKKKMGSIIYDALGVESLNELDRGRASNIIDGLKNRPDEYAKIIEQVE